MARGIAIATGFVLVAAIALVALSAGTVEPATAGESGPLQATPEGFTDAEFEIRVYGNGSARWTVRAGRSLDNQSEVDQFRAFAEEFETTETTAARNFEARARRLVAFGTNATGREMNATAFDRDARVVELGTTRGVVELSFRWTNFARTDGQRVIVDDVFEGGMFIDTGQRLVIAHGDGLTFESVDPPPDSQSVEGDLGASETVTWLGERDFTDRRPRAVLVPPELAGEETTTGTDSTATSAPGEDPAGGPGLLAVLVVVIILVGLGGGFALYSGAVGDFGRSGGGTESGGVTSADSAASAGSTDSAAVPEEEIVSDEKRVVRLLEDNGGRMNQVEIVEQTDWSKSKVSMLLSDMEEEGTISKLRVGRENIISKAGHEPEAAGSPFEEDSEEL